MKFFLVCAVFFSFPALSKICGQTGTIEERIKECAVTKENFVLVASDDKGLEVYQDVKTKLIWGIRQIADFNHYGSQKACDDIPEATILKDLKWRLPTVREFDTAASHGMKAALPNMQNWFWTSTPIKRARKWRRRQPTQAYLWDGVGEKTDAGDLRDAASVRCVSKG